MGFRAWRKARVRLWEPTARFYIRITPNFGLSLPWFGGRRIRIAWHHGIQIVKWVGDRWYVQKQVLGRSRVKGENYHASVRNT